MTAAVVIALVSHRPGDPAPAREVVPQPAPAEVLRYDNRIALVVGVNHYKHLAEVPYGVDDAASVAAVLAERFQFRVTLVVDAPPTIPLPQGVDLVRSAPGGLTAAKLNEHLNGLPALVQTKADGLFFFYSGHGTRANDKAYLSLADAHGNTNLVDCAVIAKALRAAKAHHTLMVLNSCNSGEALAPASGVGDAVADIASVRPLILKDDSNLNRVFKQPGFQLITAASGEEKAAAVFAEEVAKLSPVYQGRSPFTAVLLQGLQGGAGLPNGSVLGSELGFYVNHALVADARLRGLQKPQSARLGGEGDFLFVPVPPVLNPKLLGPLHLTGARYDELHESACVAVAAAVSAERDAAARARLGREAVTHLVSALHQGPRAKKAAADALAGLADAYPADSLRTTLPVLKTAVGPLRAVAADTQLRHDVRYAAAQALGRLAAFPEANAVVRPVAALLGEAVHRNAVAPSAAAARGVATVAEALVRLGPAAVPALTDALGDPSHAVQAAAATALGQIGPPAAPAVEKLGGLLTEPKSPDERAAVRAAVVALGEIGPGAAPAIPNVVRVVAAAKPRVLSYEEEMLGAGLGSTYGVPSPFAKPKNAPIKGYGQDVTDAARVALARIGPAAIPHIEQLVASGEHLRAWAGAVALGEFGEKAARSVPKLIDLFVTFSSPAPPATPFGWGDSGPDINQLLSDVAGAIGRVGPTAVPHLEERLSNLKGTPRWWVAYALSLVRQPNGEPTAALLKLSDDADPTIRVMVIGSLSGGFHIDDAAVASRILAAGRDAAPGVRLAAMQGIARMRPSDRVIDALTDGLRDAHAATVRTAIRGEARAGARAAHLRPVLERMLVHPSGSRIPDSVDIRQEAAAALSHFPGGSETARGMVRARQWKSLVLAHGWEAPEEVAPHVLSAPDGLAENAFRWTDAVGVHGTPADDSVPTLLTYLRPEFGAYREDQLSAVKAIAAVGARGSPSVARHLIRGLESPDRAVWEAAVHGLVAQGPWAVPPLVEYLKAPPPAGAPKPADPEQLLSWDGHDAPPVLGWNQDPVGQRRLGAALALAELDPTSEHVLPHLLKALGGTYDVDARNLIGRAVVRVGREPTRTAEVVAQMRAALVGRRREAARSAAVVIRLLGPAARDAVPDLIAALSRHPTPDVQERVAETLAQLGNDARDALPALRRELGDENPDVRLCAAIALLRIADADEAVAREAATREVMAELTRIVAPGRPTRPFTRHTGRAISTAAECIPRAEVLPVFLAILKSAPYVVFRADAADALVRLGDSALGPLLGSLTEDGWTPIQAPSLAELLSQSAFRPLRPDEATIAVRRELLAKSGREVVRFETRDGPQEVMYDRLRAEYPTAWVRRSPVGPAFDMVGGVPASSSARGGLADARHAAATAASTIAGADLAKLARLRDAAKAQPDQGTRAFLYVAGDAPVSWAGLRDALGDIEPSQVRWVVGSIVAFGPQGFAPVLVLCDDHRPVVVEAAVNAIASLGPAAAPAVPAFTRLLKAKAPEVRLAAAWALGEIGPAAAGASDELAAALADGPVELRRAAAYSLGYTGARTPAVVAALTRALNDADQQVQGNAARALGRVGAGLPPRDRAGVAASLVPRLAAAPPAVKFSLVQALGRFGGDAAEAVPALLKILPELELTSVVIDTLAEIGPKAAAAVPALVAVLAEQYEEAVPVGAPRPYLSRWRAAFALSRIGPDAPREIIPILKSGKCDRRFAALAVEFMGEAGRPAVPALIEVLRATAAPRVVAPAPVAPPRMWGGAASFQHPYVVSGAVVQRFQNAQSDDNPYAYVPNDYNYGNMPDEPIDPNQPFRLAPINELMRSPEVRIAAIHALIAIGPGAAAAPVLREALNDNSSWFGPGVRLAAADALRRLAQPDPATVGGICVALAADEERPGLYGQVHRVPRIPLPVEIEAVAAGGPAAVLPLLAYLANGTPEVRCAAATQLGRFRTDRVYVVRGLAAAMRDAEWTVRARAVRALVEQRAAGENAAELIRLLGDGHAEVVFAAWSALCGAGDRATDRLVRVAPDAPPVVRALCAVALVARGHQDPAVFDIVSAALGHADPVVRAATVEVIGRLGLRGLRWLGRLDEVRKTDTAVWVRTVAAKSIGRMVRLVPRFRG